MPPDCPDCAAAVTTPWWHLFDSTPWVPRDLCGAWPAWLMYTGIAAALCIAAIYFGVFVWEMWTARSMRGTDYPRWAAISIGLFFLGCAGGHLWDAVAFRWPAYRLFVCWELYTLATSVVGLFAFRRVTTFVIAQYRALAAERRLRAAAEAAIGDERERAAALVRAAQAEAAHLKIELSQSQTELTILRMQPPSLRVA